MSSRNPASTPVLSVVVALATTPSSIYSASRGSTRGAVASLSDCWLIQTTSAPGVITILLNVKAWPIDGKTVTEVDIDSAMLDVKATFCYLGDMLHSSGAVTALLPPDIARTGESSGKSCLSNFQTPLAYDTQQGVCGLCPLSCVPWR